MPGQSARGRFAAPGSRIRRVAATVLALATAALLIERIRVGGWPEPGALERALRENLTWLVFWGLFLALTRREPPPPVSLGRSVIPLRPRRSPAGLVAAALLLLPMLVLFGLAGDMGGASAFVAAALLATSFGALVIEMQRHPWLAGHGLVLPSPWTGRARLLRWSEMAALVEERGLGRDALRVVGLDGTGVRLPFRSEGMAELATLLLSQARPEVLAASATLRARLARISESGASLRPRPTRSAA